MNEQLWLDCLEDYAYSVDLSVFAHAEDYPGAFAAAIAGDRASTVAFAAHVQVTLQDAPLHAAGEVTFWKQFSNPLARNQRTQWVLQHVNPESYQAAIFAIVETGSFNPGLGAVLDALHSQTRAIPEATAHVALADPEGSFPVIDRWVATWVNERLHAGVKPTEGEPALQDFAFVQIGANQFGINDTQLPSAEAFTNWARHRAMVLADLQPQVGWTARDVEMAIFAAQRRGVALF